MHTLKKGAMGVYSEYFCRVAHPRARALGYTGKPYYPEKENIKV